jgi:hypothetical protein
MSEPTQAQKELIKFYGLNPNKHLVVQQSFDSLKVWHKKKHVATLLRR